MIYDRLISGHGRMAVVGLGYVGLPLALAFARHVAVSGYDINPDRVALMRRGEDPSGELPPSAFDGADIIFDDSPEVLADACFYVVAVPTPVDNDKRPDLNPLCAAVRSVARVLQPGDYVVFESTFYPGCTDEVCVPLLEEISGLRCGRDFKVGYSPERINPGDSRRTVADTVKLVSGCDEEALEEIARVYGMIVRAGLHRVSSLRVAEAAKILENTQRDVNIALMNEFAMICGSLGIDTYEVLDAASTKWNFNMYSPGLVGGHCIGVDPWYLVHKADAIQCGGCLIPVARAVNDSMSEYVAANVSRLIGAGEGSAARRVLILGFTFKENVADIRNTKVADIVKSLKRDGIAVDVADPVADAGEVERQYGIALSEMSGSGYDAVIVAVAHDCYLGLDLPWFESHLRPGGVVADLKGIFRRRLAGIRGGLRYWSL